MSTFLQELNELIVAILDHLRGHEIVAAHPSGEKRNIIEFESGITSL